MSSKQAVSCADAASLYLECMRPDFRNTCKPHSELTEVETARPDWDENAAWSYSKTREPSWTWGQGANDGGESLNMKHVEVNPYEDGRPPVFNYKLLISGIVPRPLGLLSTMSKDGTKKNLAPFSYSNMVAHDPPIFAVGISGAVEKTKDTLANLIDSGECVFNMISEHFIEAANATAVNAPYGISEWELSGLHPAPSTMVKPPRVKESVFAVECKLLEMKEFESRITPGKRSGTLVLLEGINFWVREDAISEDKSIIDPAVLRPVSRLGGIIYGRITSAFELRQPDFRELSPVGFLNENQKHSR